MFESLLLLLLLDSAPYIHPEAVSRDVAAIIVACARPPASRRVLLPVDWVARVVPIIRLLRDSSLADSDIFLLSHAEELLLEELELAAVVVSKDIDFPLAVLPPLLELLAEQVVSREVLHILQLVKQVQLTGLLMVSCWN